MMLSENARASFLSGLIKRSWLGRMWQYRELILAMARRETTDRYVGQMLGPLWTIGHPLLLITIYIIFFAFALNSRAGVGGRGDYLLYMLCGLIPWMAIQDAMMRGTAAVVSHANLVKQVAFPLEVLPVKTILAALLNQLISTVLFLVYVLWSQGSASAMWLLFPPLFCIQFVGLLGLGYFFASVGVFFRDLKDVLTVFCTGAIYCLPIFYQLDNVPRPIRIVVQCNPFTHLLFCYQDIFLYKSFEHPWSWIGVSAASIVLFYVGHRAFQRLRPIFGNQL